jgi:ankyrin repeat protein
VAKSLINEVWTEFLESLCTPDYQQDRLQIRDASKTTCEWVWDHTDYLCYRKSAESSILHVVGKAGSGKSVLAKHVWKRLSTEIVDSPEKGSSALLYYCCNKRTRPDETALSILRALVHQFLLQRPSLFGMVILRSELMQSHSFLEKQTTWTFDSLWSIFKDIVINSQLQMIHCIIDALDESEKESMEKFLSLLPELLVHGTNHPTVKFFLTSRIEGHIMDCLEGHATRIQVDSVAHEDVDTYIRERLGKLKRLRLDAEGEQNVRKILVDHAEGMFLWAELAIKDLERAHGFTAKTLASRVRSLPSGLNAIYERMLIKIDGMCDDEDTVNLVRKIFTWVALATRPLTLAELRIALAIELECADSVEPLQNISHDLLDLCGSFIEIVRTEDNNTQTRGELPFLEDQTKNEEKEDLSATVRLIHQSAREYLIDSHGRLNGPLLKFRVDNRAGHSEIARTCLTYLLCRDFEGGPIKETIADSCEPTIDPTAVLEERIEQKLADHKFLDYATLHWPTHLRESSNTDEGQRALLHACKFLSGFPMHLKGWCQVLIFIRHFDIKLDSHFTGVHAAAFLGLTEALRLLFDRGAEIMVKTTDQRTALHYAAFPGHVGAVKLLLDRGAEIDAKEKDEWTALHLTARDGHIEMMKLLLDRGAEVDAREKGEGTALHIAASNGYIDVVKLLLDRGAEIDAEEKDEWTALHFAARYGHIEVVKLLLDRGAEVDAKEKDKGTALHIAASNGYIDMVKLLLDRGAEVDAKDKDEWTARHLAARYGYIETMKLLLDRGAQIDAKQNEEWTALHIAADDGHIEVVKLLLDRGAEVDAKEKYEWTALHLAARSGYIEVVKLLLDRGAQIDAKQNDEWTALHFAAKYGHIEVVKLLLNRGAQIDAKQIYEWTALHLAAKYGHVEVVKLILDRGAQIDANQKYEWTALHLAAGDGHVEVVKLILDRGAEINAKGKEEWTALHLAASNGHVEVVKLLLDQGAEIDAKQKNRWTALHVAASNGHIEVVKLILDRGTEINAKEKYEWTALHLAARYGHVEVVKLLLDQGVEIDAKEDDEWTALHLAAIYGHIGVVKLLFEKGANLNTGERGYVNALQASAYNGNEALVQLLIEKQTGVNPQNYGYGDALQLGCIKGNVAVVDCLLRAGANPNTTDQHGWTPIYCASQCQQKAVLNSLVSAGGDLDAAQNTIIPPTSWSLIDKSTRLLLDESGMSVRYFGKASLPFRVLRPNQQCYLLRYRKRWNDKSCLGSSKPPSSTSTHRLLL